MTKGDQDEKEMGKREEKDEKSATSRDEKSFDEKYRRDPLSAIAFAVILIWGGVVLLFVNLGLLDLFEEFRERVGISPSELPFNVPFFENGGWSVFWLGASIILMAVVVLRLLVPSYRRPLGGTIFWALAFLGLAIGNWSCIGPLILIGIGVSLILRSFTRRDKM
jgi:hypothetical protein